jgi:hypothetical protein
VTRGVDLAAVTRLLIGSRLTWPGSKLKAWQRQAELFGHTPVKDLGHVYAGLDEIARLAPVFQTTAWEALGRTAADLATVDYDVTNYFFHIDNPDPSPVGNTVGRGQATRQKGYSKEHRPDPIIQMGLFLDSDGIPVSYRLFDGNTPDMSTLTSAITEFKTMFNPGRIVAVADKGLNTGPNIIALHDRGDGWIVAGSHRRGHDIREWILDPDGWVWNPDKTAKTKTTIVERVVTITKTSATPKRQVSVTERIVAAWSQAAETRDRTTRADLLVKAEHLIHDEPGWRAGGKRGPRKYIVTETIDPTTGEITTSRDALLSINQALVDYEAELDGYHLVRTSETHLDPQAILDRYHQLWQIEQAFRVSKTDLDARPVYVWTPEHIEAHFLICFLALLITRLLEHTTGIPSSQLIRAIQSFQATPCGHGIYRLQRPGWENIEQAIGVTLDQTWATTDQIRAWSRDLKTTTGTLSLTTRHK